MAVQLPCGCKDTVMCAAHEAAWYERHRQYLREHANDNAHIEIKVHRINGIEQPLPAADVTPDWLTM